MKTKARERRQKKRLEKKKKTQLQKQQATSQGSTTVRDNVSASLVGSSGIERIRTFKIDGVEVKGDVSPPLRAQQHEARSFERTDGQGTVDLWWCWNCGKPGGLWKKHQTYDCPRLRSEGNTSNDCPTSNGESSSNTGTTQDTQHQFRFQQPNTASFARMHRHSPGRHSHGPRL